jgi:hypothetical protein
MRNEAKQSEKDAKQNSKLAKLSETKRKKMRITQFCLHEPLKTILNQSKPAKSEPVSHVSFWFTMVLNGKLKHNFNEMIAQMINRTEKLTRL